MQDSHLIHCISESSFIRCNQVTTASANCVSLPLQYQPNECWLNWASICLFGFVLVSDVRRLPLALLSDREGDSECWNIQQNSDQSINNIFHEKTTLQSIASCFCISAISTYMAVVGSSVYGEMSRTSLAWCHCWYYRWSGDCILSRYCMLPFGT